MNDDAELLRRYAESGSETAFAELVHRHTDLVFGAALRRTGDAHRAADVAQQVFTTLAREAEKLSRHAVLAAWLHTATRNAALNLMIAEHRRQARETGALALAPAAGPAGAEPDWDRLRPLLDGAIDELPETDRAAVVLRFLEHRPFAEVGRALQVSADAARVRTDRALDKLRAALARRGITSTAAALGVVVSGQPVVFAPAGLAATLASQSLAAAGTGVASGALASLMTTKLVTTALLSALVAFGAGTYIGHNRAPGNPPPSPPTLREATLIASLRQDNQRLQAETAGLKADVTRLTAANAEQAARPVAPAPVPVAMVPKSPNIGLPLYELQRAVINNLRQIDAARSQYALENGRPPASIQDLVGVKSYIRAVRTVGGEDYSGLSMLPASPLTVTTPDGVSVTYDPAGTMTTRPEIPPAEAAMIRVQELGQKVQGSAMKALDAYRAAHNGANPPNEEAILTYFATPQEGADYVEFMEARKAAGRK